MPEWSVCASAGLANTDVPSNAGIIIRFIDLILSEWERMQTCCKRLDSGSRWRDGGRCGHARKDGRARHGDGLRHQVNFSNFVIRTVKLRRAANALVLAPVMIARRHRVLSMVTRVHRHGHYRRSLGRNDCWRSSRQRQTKHEQGQKKPAQHREAVGEHCCKVDEPIFAIGRIYTLNLKCSTSPSFTTYSLPSWRSFPASRAPLSPFSAM